MTLSAHREASLRTRWEEWIPIVYFESRKMGDPSAFRARCVETQRRRFIALTTRDIPMSTIRRLNLDSPFITEEVFSAELDAACARRLPRLGRVKGIRRTREEIHQNVTN